MSNLPCEDGGGSLNNPNGSPEQLGTNNSALQKYVAPSLPIGEWQISNLDPDNCAKNDQLRQETYVAEVLNIAGAPINIFKLLGVHEQGQGSVLSEGLIISSTPFPGFPATGINGSTPWKSLQVGSAVVTSSAYVGIDFGIKKLSNGSSEYKPSKAKWTDVAAISITQANTANEFAKQVRVELTDGNCTYGTPIFSGSGNGTLAISSLGSEATQATVYVVALTPTTFNVYAILQDNSVIGLNTATVGVPFFSTVINFTINNGSSAFAGGDIFSIPLVYEWKRQGIYNLIQSPLPQIINFQTTLKVKALRIAPTLFTGTGNWEVYSLDVLDSAPTDINNVQDLFFNENRDRDYAKEPIILKAQFSPSDSLTDLGRFGLSILDQYSFTVSFASMVEKLGRPLVVGDIVEVIPEMQWDQNLSPVRKFLEITDCGWSAEGFSTMWKPTVYRFSAEQVLPSQETRDIFGTLDTQKYMIADSILNDDIAEQLNTYPLTQTEEISKTAKNNVPETGSNDRSDIEGVPVPSAHPAQNPKGQPTSEKFTFSQNAYIEDGLPPNGESYGEGFKLPELTSATDGEYFRLYYPPETKIPARLYRYSALKNKWIYLETDRRTDYTSHKPSVQKILQSDSKKSLNS